MATANPGFTDATRQTALDIQTRLLAGESVPREELLAFIKLGEKDLSAGIRLIDSPPKQPKPTPPKDVDFF
jgi:hypothetical protein